MKKSFIKFFINHLLFKYSFYPKSRRLRSEEKKLLKFLLQTSYSELSAQLNYAEVSDMKDGGMGSIRFRSNYIAEADRKLGCKIAEARYIDLDGIPVSIAINKDQFGNLWEVDMWKTDFTPLLKYPAPNDLTIESK